MIGNCLLSNWQGRPDSSVSTTKVCLHSTARDPFSSSTVILLVPILTTVAIVPLTNFRSLSKLRIIITMAPTLRCNAPIGTPGMCSPCKLSVGVPSANVIGCYERVASPASIHQNTILDPCIGASYPMMETLIGVRAIVPVWLRCKTRRHLIFPL